jgi:hypothetical protein
MSQPNLFTTQPAFDGADYQPDRDTARLDGQLDRIRRYMADGQWRTLQAIAEATGAPPASVSAQLRNLRKTRFGGWTVQRRYDGHGLYQYRVMA